MASKPTPRDQRRPGIPFRMYPDEAAALKANKPAPAKYRPQIPLGNK